MKCGSGKRTRSSTNGPRRARVRASQKISVMKTPICSAPSAQAVTPAPPSSCRMPTRRRCANTLQRSAVPWRPAHTPWSFSIKPLGIPRASSRSRKTSPWCRCRQPVRNSTRRRTSGRQYLRQTYLSNRVFKSYTDILDACQDAWQRLLDETGRIASIATRDWATISQSI